MIADILITIFAFVLGYAIFMSSTYFLAKWMLPRIEDQDDLALSSGEKGIHHTVRDGRYITR